MRIRKFAAVLAAVTCITLPQCALAQLSTTLDTELRRDYGRAALFTMSGLDDVQNGSGATLLAARGGFTRSGITMSADASLLVLPSAANAASLGAGAAFALRDTRFQLHLAAGYQSATRGRRVIEPRVSVERGSFSLGFRTALLRGAPALYRDTILPLDGEDPDTGHIVTRPREPDRAAGYLFAGYTRAWHRLDLGGVVTTRIADLQSSIAATAMASLRVADGIAVGASYGRESGRDWLGRASRNTTMFFARITPPSARDNPVKASKGQPLIHVATEGATVITVIAPGATRVYASGDFSDWQPVDMKSTQPNEWTYRASLPPGVYHIRIRIDDGPWIVPIGLPTLADDFGGETGVFVVSGRPN